MKTGITHICDAIDNGLYLRLIDGCFVIVKGANILAKMCCFNGLNSPLDSYDQKNLYIPAHSVELLFDNRINEYMTKVDKNLKAFMNRGFILWANYPEFDMNGLPVPDEKLSLKLRVTTVGFFVSPEKGESPETEFTYEVVDIPWYKFFTTLQNPITPITPDTPDNYHYLIDKVEIVNDNDYEVNVNSLLINVRGDGASLDNVLIGC